MVTYERAYLLHAGDVPDLDLGIARPNRQVAAISRPGQAADVVTVVGHLAKRLHAAGAGVPEVHCAAEGHSNDVLARPVQQVEVVVVNQVRRIQDAVLGLGDVTIRLASGSGTRILVVQLAPGVLEALCGYGVVRSLLSMVRSKQTIDISQQQWNDTLTKQES